MAHPRLTRLCLGVAMGWAALLLGGCAMPRLIDSEVVSFVGTPGAVRGASYRFERLPSQQALGAEQDSVETMAAPALERAGLVRNDAQARYSVQVEVKVEAYRPAPRIHPHASSLLMPYDALPLYPGAPLFLESPWYKHTVHLVLRDSASAQVVYESTARFDGPWADSAKLLPAVLEAALHGYPTPPAGPRTVVMELSGDKLQAR